MALPGGSIRGRRHRLPWRQNPDRCFRTRTCGLLGRSSDCAGSARHIARRYRKAPPPEAGRSSAQSPSAAACRATPKSSCPSPSCRSALCPDEACPEDLQARHRQSAAANGSRSAAGRRPPCRLGLCREQVGAGTRFTHADGETQFTAADYSPMVAATRFVGKPAFRRASPLGRMQRNTRRCSRLMREKDARRAALAKRDATAAVIGAGDFIGSAIAK
jgi:hypothetical protein